MFSEQDRTKFSFIRRTGDWYVLFSNDQYRTSQYFSFKPDRINIICIKGPDDINETKNVLVIAFHHVLGNFYFPSKNVRLKIK